MEASWDIFVVVSSAYNADVNPKDQKVVQSNPRSIKDPWCIAPCCVLKKSGDQTTTSGAPFVAQNIVMKSLISSWIYRDVNQRRRERARHKSKGLLTKAILVCFEAAWAEVTQRYASVRGALRDRPEGLRMRLKKKYYWWVIQTKFRQRFNKPRSKPISVRPPVIF